MQVNLQAIRRSGRIGIAAASIVISLGACSSSVKLDEAGAKIESRTGVNPALIQGGAIQGPVVAPERTVQTVTVNNDPSTDASNPISKRSIYFDYDSFELRADAKPIVEAHAKYLVANKGRKVTLQGNTDERGSREYNLALGQKRAEAVRKALASLGVPDAQMEATSFGEEKPKASGSDEAAFSENRRTDLAY